MKAETLRENIASRHDYLEKLIELTDRGLERLPEGKLRIQRQGNSVSFHHVENDSRGNGHIISPDNIKLAEGLAQRSYLKKLRRAAERETELIDRILIKYPEQTAEDIYDNLPRDRKALVKPVILSDKEYEERWIRQSYTPKEFQEGSPVYLTSKGERVR